MQLRDWPVVEIAVYRRRRPPKFKSAPKSHLRPGADLAAERTGVRSVVGSGRAGFGQRRGLTRAASPSEARPSACRHWNIQAGDRVAASGHAGAPPSIRRGLARVAV
jgi:hypothetical protein